MRSYLMELWQQNNIKQGAQPMRRFLVEYLDKKNGFKFKRALSANNTHELYESFPSDRYEILSITKC